MKIAQVAFLAILLIALTTSFARGGKPERLASVMVFAAALISPLLQTDNYDTPQAMIAGLDILLLIGLTVVATWWFRQWLLLAIGCQLLTVLAHLTYLLGAQLSPETYSLLTILWAYPLLASLTWGAWQHGLAQNIDHGGLEPNALSKLESASSGAAAVITATRAHEYELDVATRLFRNNGCGQQSAELAATVLARAGSLAAATQLPTERLRHWGLDQRVISALALARDTINAALVGELEKGPVLSDSEAVLKYLRLQLGHLPDEQLRAIFLNNQHRLLGQSSIGSGSINSVLAHPRQVLREAIDIGATFVILAHNHPSGDLTASREDIRFTKQVAAALRAAEITLIDHIIIAGANHASLRAEGYI